MNKPMYNEKLVSFEMKASLFFMLRNSVQHLYLEIKHVRIIMQVLSRKQVLFIIGYSSFLIDQVLLGETRILHNLLFIISD